MRTIWETYVGWFKLQSSAELYPDRAYRSPGRLMVEALGVDATLDHARAALDRGEALWRSSWPKASSPSMRAMSDAARLMADAHRWLLEAGGAINFWENGWLRSEMRRWMDQADPAPG